MEISNRSGMTVADVISALSSLPSDRVVVMQMGVAIEHVRGVDELPNMCLISTPMAGQFWTKAWAGERVDMGYAPESQTLAVIR